MIISIEGNVALDAVGVHVGSCRTGPGDFAGKLVGEVLAALEGFELVDVAA